MSKMPSEPVLNWAADAVGAGAKVVGAEGIGKNQGPQPTWRLRMAYRGTTVEAVLKTGPLSWIAGFTSEAAGMAFAEEHNLPAPRLLAADLQGTFGVLAILSTALPGSSWRPWKEEPSIKRLRGLGAAAAQLHAIPLSPRPDLPLRTHHIPHDDYVAERRWAAQYQTAPDSEKGPVFEELLRRTGWPREPLQRVLTGTRTTPLIRAAE